MPGGMPTGPVVAPAAPPAVGAPAARPSIFSGFLGTVMRMGAMWLVMSFLRPKTAPVAGPGEVLSKSFPKFPKGYPMDMYAFISEKPALREYDMGSLIWSERGVELGGKGIRSVSVPYEPSPAVQHNGSVYLHVVFAPPKKPINPSEPGYDESNIFAASHNLVKYIPRPKNDTGVNLLSSDALPTKEQVYNKTVDIISVFKPNLTIQIVDHFATYPHRSSVPDPLKPFVMFDSDGHHYPILHINEFWLLRDKMIPLNDTVSNVTLHLELSTVSAWWWQLMTAMEQSFKTQAGWGMQQEGESDELKRILLEGNPYLLVLTFFVSMLHTVFDLLAFKNDIGFWKNNKSMEGLSARTVVINAACQVVILLYLFDSDTSYVVLLSATLGTAIEIWKVSKAFKMTVDRTKFPYIKLEDRASYSVAQTKQHDEDAIRYLSYVLLPLVIGYSIYTLKYKTHKSWYSWVVSTLVGAVYMFGFILMCPQLYLNYKLKSVAHLPWRQLTYKFLNTIIDDLFAFVIKMPLLHRLSVFRDDLVFLVYLYQRWIYRVDLTRTNEFGYSGIEPGAEGTEPVAALEGTETPAATGAAGITAPVKRSTRAATAAAADADVPPASDAVAAEPKKDK